ncbi:MAG: helix-turn-helix domain-containing protein [Planctomycetaceae bacterium]|nr:helix-turn-helix domain-containing protein [Planctomycetaceae bacterium]
MAVATPNLKRKKVKGVTSRKIARRWTAKLAAKGFTPVCDYFLENYDRLNLTNTEAMVIIHLMSYKWDSSKPFPSIGRLASRMGIGETAVRGHIRRIEQKGCLVRNFRTGNTNEFDLTPLFEKLEANMESS